MIYKFSHTTTIGDGISQEYSFETDDKDLAEDLLEQDFLLGEEPNENGEVEENKTIY